MEKKKRKDKGKVEDDFGFIFFDKNGIEEVLFAKLYTPLLIRNPSFVRPAPNPYGYLLPAVEALRPSADSPKKPTRKKKPLKITERKCFGAYYNHQTGHLSVSIAGKRETINNPREVFCEYASFNEILDEIRPLPTNELFNLVSAAKNQGDVKSALRAIQLEPTYLLDKKMANLLSEVIRKARWSTNRKERSENISLLNDYLIPKSPGGETPLPPGWEYADELLSELAEHLKGICKSHVNINLARGRKDPIHPDDLEAIITAARQQGEWRISTLSYYHLDLLIRKTRTFVDDLITACLNVSTKKLSRKK
ncbi:MAG: hypothetical protein IT388_12005 [Nitrospirales bacterium]|nr:hypothetical protein [Nitrospirales bacterium]